MDLEIKPLKANPLIVGFIANSSNPYVYIFWFTVGAPLIIRTKQSNFLSAILFGVIYYLCLVGSKIIVGFAVEKSRHFLENGYKYIMNALGVILLVFSVLIFKDGIFYLLT
jgi:threonine/homoserine/homoserine lactone efflux protein